MPKTLAAAMLLVSLALYTPASVALSGEKKGPSRADRVQLSSEASAIAEDGTQTIKVTLKIDKGWTVYANHLENQDLQGVRTVVSVTGEKGLERVSVEYPPGETINGGLVGDYRVYTGEVTVNVRVRRAKSDCLPLNITVNFYPFEGKTCGVVETKTVILR